MARGGAGVPPVSAGRIRTPPGSGQGRPIEPKRSFERPELEPPNRRIAPPLTAEGRLRESANRPAAFQPVDRPWRPCTARGGTGVSPVRSAESAPSRCRGAVLPIGQFHRSLTRRRSRDRSAKLRVCSQPVGIHRIGESTLPSPRWPYPRRGSPVRAGGSLRACTGRGLGSGSRRGPRALEPERSCGERLLGVVGHKHGV
jgi:hypothetical protein